MKFSKYFWILFSICVMVSCGDSSDDSSGGGSGSGGNNGGELPTYTYPKTTWGSGRFSEFGFSDQCGEVIDSFVQNNKDVTGLCLVIDGLMVHTYGTINECSYIASARKSLCSMLYGIYVDRGVINLDTTLGTLISQGIIKEDIDEMGFDGLLDIEKSATIRHCISARSGVYHQASNSGSTLDTPEKVPARGSKTPGSYYLYSNWDFNVAGSILEGYTGESIYDTFGRELAEPLQFEDWDRARQKYSRNEKKSIYPAYHFRISARDMARLGYLMLRNGIWNGKRLISEEWVKQSTKLISTKEETGSTNNGYGYMWWVFDNEKKSSLLQGSYFASGAGGQFIAVVPKKNMVLTIKRDTSSEAIGDTSFSLNKVVELLEVILEQRSEL